MATKPVVSIYREEEDGVEVSRLCAELLDSRHLILGITTGFMLLALGYAFLLPATYQANALIQVEPEPTNTVLASRSSLMPDGKPVSSIDVKLLQSRQIIGETVDDLNLQADVQPKRLPIIGNALAQLTGETGGEIDVSQLYLPGATDDKTDQATLTVIDSHHYQVDYHNKSFIAETGKVAGQAGMKILADRISALPGAQFIATYTSRLNAINAVMRNLTVLDPVMNSGMLTLTLTGNSRSETIKILDNIASHYLSQNISEQAAQDSQSLAYLDQQLPIVRSDLDHYEDKLNAAREINGTVDLPLEAQSVLDQSVAIDSQLNDLTISESEIAQLYTKDHPAYKTLQEKRNTLLTAKAKLNEKISGMPLIQQEILRLTRNVDAKHDIYMRLLARQQELKVAISGAIGNVRIVDSAVDDSESLSLQKLIIVFQGLLLGIFVSATVIFIRIAMNKAVESSDELEQRGMAVYSSIPYSEWLEKRNRKKSCQMSSAFLLRENPDDLAIEAMRSLRTNLYFAMLEARNNILMISGASASAGKTFVSTNCSAVIAQTGKKVLLIDADLRRGTAHQIFNIPGKAGLAEILAADYPISAVLPVEISDSLHFIARGKVAQGFTELLMSKRFGELMRWAEKNYDLVVIDTPPVLAVTDAEIIGTYAGTTMMVVRCAKNTVKEIEISLRRFERSGITVNGFILNGAKLRANGYYSYSDIQYSYESVGKG
ncbi:polysaccharide biosynthesis tyrosine autokinase [Pantoea sp.]|uniref:polysaccharide biosynthesis tyrosine autokinase n=1 Tax=Pantoea sp. TaxID=69393 RepID=UPI0028ABFEC4|nr:polysaccharide biosynthesis tyrosine autokinase [Pantoea sp.]